MPSGLPRPCLLATGGGVLFCTQFLYHCFKPRRKSLRPEGVEPPTYGSEDHCSIQLSYGRIMLFATPHYFSFHGCNLNTPVLTADTRLLTPSNEKWLPVCTR